MRVPSRFSGIWDFPYLRLGIRDFTSKSGRDSGLKVCERGGITNVATQVQQFNRVGVATTVWRRGRIGCDSAGKILKFNILPAES